MNTAELTVYVLALIGTALCAISGASAAIRKGLDLFGVFFVSSVTGLGGGVMRDVLLSNLPPAMFRDPSFVLICLAASVAVFLVAHYAKSFFQKSHRKWDIVLNVIDAVGLSSFTVLGVNTAITMGFTDNVFFLVFLGMTTGIGGGVLRDIILNDIPAIFTKHVYAVAAIIGSCVYVVLLLYLSVPEIVSALICIATVTVLRIFAARFRWNFPKAF